MEHREHHHHPAPALEHHKVYACAGENIPAEVAVLNPELFRSEHFGPVEFHEKRYKPVMAWARIEETDGE